MQLAGTARVSNITLPTTGLLFFRSWEGLMMVHLQQDVLIAHALASSESLSQLVIGSPFCSMPKQVCTSDSSIKPRQAPFPRAPWVSETEHPGPHTTQDAEAICAGGCRALGRFMYQPEQEIWMLRAWASKSRYLGLLFNMSTTLPSCASVFSIRWRP